MDLTVNQTDTEFTSESIEALLADYEDDPDDYEIADDLMAQDETLLLNEDEIKKEWYSKLCESEDDVVILEWRGRFEEDAEPKPDHPSIYDRPFDMVCFRRTHDRYTSPILVAYEVKGITVSEKGKIRRPSVLAGMEQLMTYIMFQDADYACLITIPRKNPTENKHLEEAIKCNPSWGLIFVKAVNGKRVFETVVKPRERSLRINQDKKKANLIVASLWQKPWVGEIRRRDWAREADYVLPSDSLIESHSGLW